MKDKSSTVETQDSDLIAEVLNKNSERAKRALYERYVQRVFRQCLGYRGLLREDAEDIVQEVFVSAFHKLSSLEQSDKFGAWLRAITHNQCLKVLNSKLRQLAAEKGYEAEYHLHLEAPDEYEMREKEIEIVQELIAALENEDLRNTVESFYRRGLSCEQIAQEQGVNVSVVTTRLCRFRAKVQRELIRRILELRS